MSRSFWEVGCRTSSSKVSQPRHLGEAVSFVYFSILFIKINYAKFNSDEIRQILHDHFDAEFDARFVGSKDAIDCVPLDCLGPWHQQHADGHEKLSAQALRMGDITLPIYAFKDQFSTFVPYMCCLPNVRLSNVIGHVFLDLVEEYGCVPIQLTTDKGSEVGDMVRCQECLR
ncbi:hypothetical protein EDB19DRAFT_1635630 [Suillus lakei]|nr:hypothetical protein EDB19DRAFT_1635630 [Suillus lakei]